VLLLLAVREILVLHDTIDNLQLSISGSRQEIASLQRQLSNSQIRTVESEHTGKLATADQRSSDARVPPTSVAEELSKRAVSPTAALNDRMVTWRTKQVLSEVEEQLALSVEESEQLTQALTQRLSSGEPISDAGVLEVIAESLGSESANSYHDKQHQAYERDLDERLHAEVVVLARDLSLSDQQEHSARAALAQIEVDLRPKRAALQSVMREAMANHLGGDEAKDALALQYETLKKLNAEIKSSRDKAVYEALAPSLSDQQRNALLAAQSG